MPHDGRFKTGQVCPASGVYGFAGHVDASVTDEPTPAEREIPLAPRGKRANQVRPGNSVVRGCERFPPLRSTGTAVWWVLRSFA